MINSSEISKELKEAAVNVMDAGKSLIGATIAGVRTLARLTIYPAIFIGGMIFGGVNLESDKSAEKIEIGPKA